MAIVCRNVDGSLGPALSADALASGAHLHGGCRTGPVSGALVSLLGSNCRQSHSDLTLSRWPFTCFCLAN